MPEQRILALNCGSSSLKFGVYSSRPYSLDELLFESEAEEIGEREVAAAFDDAMRAISKAGFAQLDAVGHRVVHGGPKLRDHVRLDDEVLQELKAAVPFAPLHLPASLAVIEAVSKAMPALTQVICLDTAFHKDLPDVAKTLPFPKRVRDRGIERYGFHGLSVESIVEQLKPIRERTVVAHLGSGSSITALRHGKSIDTTMGLTPSGGVMMGTRCGDADPGVLLYLMRQGVDAAELESIVDHESGLLGVSEKASDVRALLEARKMETKSDLALRMFAYEVRKAIAGMAAALGGMDELIFTGGIGEHAEGLRGEICEGLSFLGQFAMKALPAQEDLQIARITKRLLSA